ncbi:hypothetical protein HYW84_01450 [Candidatus Peregrinibacteria bacterium]|nr:hypothetical protein [Candidatus Peregrinibacteria bacterium]
MELRLLYFASPEMPGAPEATPAASPNDETLNKEYVADMNTKKQIADERRKREEDEKRKQGDPDLILHRDIVSEEITKKTTVSGQAGNPSIETPANRQKSINDDLAQLPLATDSNRKSIVDRIFASGPEAIRPLLNAITQAGNRSHVKLYRDLLLQLDANTEATVQFVERTLMQRQPLTSADVEELPYALYRLGQFVTGYRWGANALVPNRVSPAEERFLRSRAVELLRPLMHLRAAARALDLNAKTPAGVEAVADLFGETIWGLSSLASVVGDEFLPGPEQREAAMHGLLNGLRRNHQRLFESTSTGEVRKGSKYIIDNLRRTLAFASPEIRTQATQALRIMLTLPDTAFQEDAKQLAQERRTIEALRKEGGALVFLRLSGATASEAMQLCLGLLRDGTGGQPLRPRDIVVVIESVGVTTLGFFSPTNEALRKQWITILRGLVNNTNPDISGAAARNLETIEQLSKIITAR